MATKPMYPVPAVCAPTQLQTMFIAGTSTQLVVGNAAVLPSAPNYIRITSMDGAFKITVEYTAKNSNTLTIGEIVESNNAAARTATYLPGCDIVRRLFPADVNALQNNMAYKADLADGKIPVSQIPAVALSVLKIVADQAARFALTTDDVQTGDSVKQVDTNALYMVVDDEHLDSEAGYTKYTADPLPHASTHSASGSDPVTPYAINAAPDKQYGICSTAGNTAAKTVAIPSFQLRTGGHITVGFANGNLVSSPTLDVSSTGAKPVTWRGAPLSSAFIPVGGVYEFVYTGTAWEVVGDLVTKVLPEVHVMIIDENNSDSNACITYAGASAGLTIAQRKAVFETHNKHCVFKAAVRQYYLDETDLSKKADGEASGIEDGASLDGNIGIERDRFWWRMTSLGSKVTMVELTWDNPYDSTWTTAHNTGDRLAEYIYDGFTEGTTSTIGTTSNCLRSIYSTTAVPAVNATCETFNTYAKNTGTAEGLTADNNTYSITLPLTYIMTWIQNIWTYGTLDFQTNVARGIVDDGSSAVGKRAVGYGVSLTGGYTQGTPASSQQYTDNTCAVVGGQVNPYGNAWKFLIDCFYHYGEFFCAQKGGDHFNITTLTEQNWQTAYPKSWARIGGVNTDSGYVKQMTMAQQFPFVSKAVGGGATAYWADYTYRNTEDNDPSTRKPHCCIVGGSWYSGSHAGPFYLDLNYAVGTSRSLIGARLQAFSLT